MSDLVILTAFASLAVVSIAMYVFAKNISLFYLIIFNELEILDRDSGVTEKSIHGILSSYILLRSFL